MQLTASKHLHLGFARRASWVFILLVASSTHLALAMTRMALPPTGIGRNSDLMGQSVALRGDTALIGAPGATPTPYVYSGSAEIFRLVAGDWQREAFLQPSDGAAAMGMGTAVALGDDLVVVAAPNADAPPPFFENGGAVYTFERNDSDWLQVDKLPFAGLKKTALALSLSHDTLILTKSDVARVHIRAGAGWVQQADLIPDLPAPQELLLGAGVDGDVAVVLSQVELDVGFEYWAYFHARTGNTWSRQAKISIGQGFNSLMAIAVAGDTVLISTYEAASTVQAFVRVNDTWSLQGVLDPGQDFIGPFSLALEGDVAVLGCAGDTVLGHSQGGTAYVFERSGGAWTRSAHLYDPAVGDFSYLFGASAALSGGTILIGSPGARTDGGETGRALVFTPNAGSWELAGNLVEGNARQNEAFGSGVAVSGPTLLVGAAGTQRENVFSTGAAYVFERSGDSWIEEAQLVPTSDQSQGYGVVALDGDTAAVGASRDGMEGAVYVYTRNGTEWPQQARLVSGTGHLDDFGSALVLQGDLLSVGEPNANPNDSLGGVTYLFERAGGVWSAPTGLTPTQGAPADRFGHALAISGDTLLVGAPGADYSIEAGAGAVYVFEQSGSSWSQTAQLLAPAPTAGAGFGIAVALEGDTAVIGAGTERGGAYVFTRTGGIWSWQQTLVPGSGMPVSATFGSVVAISADEQSVLVSAPYDAPSPLHAGAVFEFHRNGDAWDAGPTFRGSPPVIPPYPEGDYFGAALAFSGSEAIIGAAGDGIGGAVYIASAGEAVFANGFDTPP